MNSKIKLLIIIVSIIALIAVVAVGIFWYQSFRAQGLDVSFNVPEKVLIGVPFEATININNASRSILKDMKFSFELPEDVVFVGQSEEKNIEYKDIGNLGVGSLTQETFQLMVLRGENSIKKLQASLIYLPTSLGAKFEKKAAFDLAVGGFGLPIDVVAPTKVFSGESFEAVISFQNNSDFNYSNLKLIIDYPPSFDFVKSSVELEDNHRFWQLGDLRKNSKNELKIQGNLSGPDGASFGLKVSIEGEFLGQRYVFSSKEATIMIAPSPLSLEIILNDKPDYIAKPGDYLRYFIRYINNTDVGLKDVVIKARLVGAMFDFSALRTDAVYRSLDNTLIWNASNLPNLSLVGPGDSGVATFEIRVKEDYPIRRLNDKNFTLQIFAEIESPTVPYFVAAKKTFSSLKFETKVAGRIKVDAQAYFRDAASGILNDGPFPPRVNRPTNFTVHWVITNFGTDVSQVEVRSFLGPNVKMTGKAKSNVASIPVYNERTQEIVWNLDKIIATKGVIGNPVEAIFQVEAIPSQPDSYWLLMQETFLKAIDDFTGEELSAGDVGLNTSLPDDRTVNAGQGIVLP